MKHFIFPMLVFISLNAFSQQDSLNGGPVNIIDGVYVGESILKPTRCFSYHGQEDEFVLVKRIWRSIESDSSINQLFFKPSLATGKLNQPSLWDVICKHIVDADFTVYHCSNPVADSITNGDQFKYPIHVRKGGNFHTDSLYAKELVEFELVCKEDSGPLVPIKSKIEPYDDSIFDDNGILLVMYEPRKLIWYTSDDIIAYHLVEDWYFCKERGIVDVRIIGIAPVLRNKSPEQASSEMFWLYYPQCEVIFKQYTLLHSEQSYSRNLADLFWRRSFTSKIYKQVDISDHEKDSYMMYNQAMEVFSQSYSLLKIIESSLIKID